jgi:hypothetical protein
MPESKWRGMQNYLKATDTLGGVQKMFSPLHLATRLAARAPSVSRSDFAIPTRRNK